MPTAINPTIDTLALLDDPQAWAAFSRPAREQADCWESNLLIEGMHCAACAVAVEDALRTVPGVLSAEVSAGSQRARVVWAAQVTSPSRLMQAVQQVGYGVVPANDVFARERRLAQARTALWRWLVAGFCMMQVMMYAYPAYVAAPGDLSAEMEQLLRWASWVLTLPVMLFSCSPFFVNALKDVAHHRVSMDLPVALGMAITFVVSTAGTFEPQGSFGREVYFDSLTMFVFFLLTGRWLELRLRDKTAGALEALMNRLPDTVERQCPLGSTSLNGGGFERIAVRLLVPGDVIRVLPGEAFAADGVVLQGHTWADEALLTGESHPVSRSTGDAVVAGSHNLANAVVVRVDRTGAATRYGDIVALMEAAATTRPHSVQLADRIAKPFLMAVLVAAAGACTYGWADDPAHALMVAVAVLIVTCPCALSLAAPAALLASVGALAKEGVLVRSLQALESLSKVDTVVFDKTGTLTGDAMVLGAVHTRVGITPTQALGMAAALAQHSRHPLSRALVAAALQDNVPTLWQGDEVTEIPGQGLSGQAQSEGNLRLGTAHFCAVQDHAGQQMQAQEGDTPQVCLSDSHGWVATFELIESVRADAQATVTALQAMGIAVHLLSGDGAQPVARVANQLGIHIAQGAATPDGKLAYLRALQHQGHRVAMVGDGLNDGPVLAGAHVSFAFGNAVPITQAHADFVVLGTRLIAVAHTLLQARRTMRVVHQNLVWAALYNAACVPFAVLGWLPAWLAGLGMALSSLAVVLNALRLSVGRGQP